MANKKSVTVKQNIANAFSQAAPTYDAAAFVEQEIGQRLLERLAYINIQPTRILDLGCATGYFTSKLQHLYPQATIIGADLALGMVNFANNNLHAPQTAFCVADAESLPFADNSFDLIFANCCFTAIEDLKLLYSELQRTLKTQGLLLFSTLGPDTLKELGLDGHWLDMHILGDAILQARLKDPVMDSEQLTFAYSALKELLLDLHQSGSYAINDIDSIPNLDQPFNASYEVIYGLAWGNQSIPDQYTDLNGDVFVAADRIKILNI